MSVMTSHRRHNSDKLRLSWEAKSAEGKSDRNDINNLQQRTKSKKR